MAGGVDLCVRWWLVVVWLGSDGAYRCGWDELAFERVDVGDADRYFHAHVGIWLLCKFGNAVVVFHDEAGRLVDQRVWVALQHLLALFG